jgi:hypothetical protein
MGLRQTAEIDSPMRQWLLTIGLSLLPLVALANPPPGTALNSQEHKWWECLQQPSNKHQPCCSLSDGHVLGDKQWKISKDHYAVELEGHWFTVPNSAVIRLSKTCGEEPNADNRPMAKVWYAPNRDMNSSITSVVWYCFLPGTLY